MRRLSFLLHASYDEAHKQTNKARDVTDATCIRPISNSPAQQIIIIIIIIVFLILNNRQNRVAQTEMRGVEITYTSYYKTTNSILLLLIDLESLRCVVLSGIVLCRVYGRPGTVSHMHGLAACYTLTRYLVLPVDGLGLIRSVRVRLSFVRFAFTPLFS